MDWVLVVEMLKNQHCAIMIPLTDLATDILHSVVFNFNQSHILVVSNSDGLFSSLFAAYSLLLHFAFHTAFSTLFSCQCAVLYCPIQSLFDSMIFNNQIT